MLLCGEKFPMKHKMIHINPNTSFDSSRVTWLVWILEWGKIDTTCVCVGGGGSFYRKKKGDYTFSIVRADLWVSPVRNLVIHPLIPLILWWHHVEGPRTIATLYDGIYSAFVLASDEALRRHHKVWLDFFRCQWRSKSFFIWLIMTFFTSSHSFHSGGHGFCALKAALSAKLPQLHQHNFLVWRHLRWSGMADTRQLKAKEPIRANFWPWLCIGVQLPWNRHPRSP